MNEPYDDELFWTAVQYAAGDLPEDAAAEFERRLEGDQATREALAQAVALSAAVTEVEAAPRTPIAVGSSRRSANLVGLLIAIAACAALIFSLPRGPHDPSVADAQPTDAQKQLAFAWVEGQADEPLVVNDVSLFDADDGLDAELAPRDVEPTAPDWLLAALADSESSTRAEN